MKKNRYVNNMEKSQKHYLSAAGQTQKLYATWLNCCDISEKVDYRKMNQMRTEVRSVREMKELCWVMEILQFDCGGSYTTRYTTLFP